MSSIHFGGVQGGQGGVQDNSALDNLHIKSNAGRDISQEELQAALEGVDRNKLPKESQDLINNLEKRFQVHEAALNKIYPNGTQNKVITFTGRRTSASDGKPKGFLSSMVSKLVNAFKSGKPSHSAHMKKNNATEPTKRDVLDAFDNEKLVNKIANSHTRFYVRYMGSNPTSVEKMDTLRNHYCGERKNLSPEDHTFMDERAFLIVSSMTPEEKAQALLEIPGLPDVLQRVVDKA